MPKEVYDVLVARWEGFKVLAKTLPDHQILAVELIRTLGDETVAVFTTVVNGEPVRSVVVGDARGRVKLNPKDPCIPAEHHLLALEVIAAPPPFPPSGGTADPAHIAVSQPPPHGPVSPGVVTVGGSLLGEAFDVAEFVDIE